MTPKGEMADGLPVMRCRVCERPYVDVHAYRAHEEGCIHERQQELDREWEARNGG